jgi:hypothetical protein
MLADHVAELLPETDIARALAGAVRFTLDRHVTDAINRMTGDPMALHRAIEHAKPPYPCVWLEMEARAHGRTMQMGYLVNELGDGTFSVMVAYGGNGVAHSYEITDVPGAIRVMSSGVMYSKDAPRDKYTVETLAIAAGHALRFFLLLNARNEVVTVDAGPDMERINKKRRRKGKPDLFTSLSVRIDLSRRIRVIHRRGGAPNHTAMAEHWVRGHFKIRKTGVFWWSPFARGNPGEVPPSYDVTHSDPSEAEEII